VRQARINPPRTLGFDRSSNIDHDAPHDQPIDIFPALTHFTDAITALPKDLVRHFTLLKEVDAKIFAPEEALFKLADAALKSTDADPRTANDATSSLPPGSAPMSAQNSSAGFSLNGATTQAPPSTDGQYNAAALDLSRVPRQHLFRLTASKLAEMILSLDEKAHVISTANEALSKHLRRVNDVWPFLEAEFSDEAKWGSTTHWAYPENRVARASAAERSRRDGASAITAAALQLAEEAAARSDARKQAVAAKKSLKNQHQDSDLDADHDSNHRQHQSHKGETGKKSGTSKSRKAVEPTAPIGLGITGSSQMNGTNPPAKRRKVENKEKAVTNGSLPMERALSGVFGANANKAKTSSPGTTPGPESAAANAPKKRKALPTLNGQAKKRYAICHPYSISIFPLLGSVLTDSTVAEVVYQPSRPPRLPLRPCHLPYPCPNLRLLLVARQRQPPWHHGQHPRDHEGIRLPRPLRTADNGQRLCQVDQTAPVFLPLRRLPQNPRIRMARSLQRRRPSRSQLKRHQSQSRLKLRRKRRQLRQVFIPRYPRRRRRQPRRRRWEAGRTQWQNKTTKRRRRRLVSRLRLRSHSKRL
jgi:hypothetical protein